MANADREVAGIRCREVLDQLSDYLDGELNAGQVGTIDRHLAGCDWCEKFGGEFVQVVKALRESVATLRPPEPIDDELLQKIKTRLQ